MSERKTSSPLLAFIAVLALLLMVAYMAGIFRERIEPGLASYPEFSSADIFTLSSQRVEVVEAVPGSVEARQTTIISSRTLSRITKIHVRAGDLVKQGQLLIELEKSDLQARSEQAREQVNGVSARLKEAEQSLLRAKRLQDRGLLADADRDTAQANRDALRAELVSAQQSLREAEAAAGFADIRAPMDGRVVDRFAEPGDTASPGNKLLSLYNPLVMRVEAQVREQLALSLTVGQEMVVELPSLDARVTGAIEEIVPAAEPGSRSFLVKARLLYDRQLLPGMYARLLVPAGVEERLLVPESRVARVGQLNLVWVSTEGGEERRLIRVGRADQDGMLEVTAGLMPGDKVLTLP